MINFGGELFSEDQFGPLLHDIALLNSLGVRLVLVHGARPQIDDKLKRYRLTIDYSNGLRITTAKVLQLVKEAVGTIRIEIEARFSQGLANSPLAGAAIRVVSGNFVTAQPLGIRDGVDYQHTGEVRRINHTAILRQLEQGDIVLLSPLGYSPTGEAFNLSAEDVATAAAVALRADKLISLIDTPGLLNGQGEVVRQLSIEEAEQFLHHHPQLEQSSAKALFSAIYACHQGVQRTHLIDRHHNGALLLELFSRDGIGTLINSDNYETIESASIDDIAGLLELIEPLEAEGVLVRRSRELLEMEINRFILVKLDSATIGCAALYPFESEKIAEIACFAIHPDYRNVGRGDRLLNYLQQIAIHLGIERLFVLTTRTSHWFLERGFEEGNLRQLPLERQRLYNYQRCSRVYVKRLQQGATRR